MYQSRIFRGFGGIHQSMNGNTQPRRPCGTEYPEHNQTGNSMHEVFNPQLKDVRKSTSQAAIANQYTKSSSMFGSSIETCRYELKDPAKLLSPDKKFRRANEASQDRLWQLENELDPYSKRALSKHELCKTRSQERYFQS